MLCVLRVAHCLFALRITHTLALATVEMVLFQLVLEVAVQLVGRLKLATTVWARVVRCAEPSVEASTTEPLVAIAALPRLEHYVEAADAHELIVNLLLDLLAVHHGG